MSTTTAATAAPRASAPPSAANATAADQPPTGGDSEQSAALMPPDAATVMGRRLWYERQAAAASGTVIVEGLGIDLVDVRRVGAETAVVWACITELGYVTYDAIAEVVGLRESQVRAHIARLAAFHYPITHLPAPRGSRVVVGGEPDTHNARGNAAHLEE